MSHSESTDPIDPNFKARHWCFTLNNPEQPLDWSAVKGVRYAVYQMEAGEETGTIHFQGYVEFSIQPRFAAVKKILPTAHWEPRKGSRDEARLYCMKEDTRVDGPWEFGTWISGQGARSDLASAVAAAKEGGLKRLAEEHPVVFVKYRRGIEDLLNFLNPPKVDIPEIDLTDQQKEILALLDGPVKKRRIFWIWSEESHTGKSTFFEYVQATRNPACGFMELRDTLCSYDGEKIIWFDFPYLYTLDNAMVNQLETLANGALVPSAKYISRKKLVKAHIVVTSNLPPPHDYLRDRLCEFQFTKVFD